MTGMPRELTTSQRIRLLRRAVESGLVTEKELGLNPFQITPPLSEGDLRERVAQLYQKGRIGDAEIDAAIGTESHGSKPSVASWGTGPRDDSFHMPEATPSAELDAFPALTEDRYTPLAFLGDGGMGRVYKAFDRQLNRVVALKFLKRLDEDTLERFIQEARAQAQIEHPNVANVYAVGQAGEVPYLSMRFIDGPTLKAALVDLNLEQKVRIIRDIAEALHACHRLGVIHRDVKPTNVMLERTDKGEWWPFIMDFGLARDLESQSGVTVSGVIVGTPVYCSPEQVQGRMNDVDRRSDVYSLGATLYECITGSAPFSAVGGLMELIRRICEEEPIPLSRRQPNLPRDLIRIVAKAMEKEPSRRYPSARALAEDLGRYLDGDPIEAQSSSLGYRLAKRIKKNKALSAVTLVSIILILALSSLGIALSLRARAQAQSAQSFGREAERMESLLFKAYSLPLHDVRAERARVLDHLDRIRKELSRQGRWSQAAGHLALGRGLMALGRHEEAREELELAWKASRGQDPEIAQALGLTLARLYQQEMEGLRGKQREDRKKELEGNLLRPALDFLHRAKGLSFESTAYVDGVLALVEERLDDALARARETQAQLPWFFDAWILEADVHRFRANAYLGRGAFADAEACLEASGAALAKACLIGRSAPQAYEAEVQRRMLYLQLRMSQGRVSRADYDWGLESIALAFKVDPENWKVHGFASAIHRRWGTALLDQHLDPSEPLEAAISSAEAGLKLRPNDTPLLNNLGTALRYKSDWEDARGLDPRPTLAKASEALQKAMARPAFMDFLLNNLGNCRAQQATWELNHGVDPTESAQQAVTCFQQASALRPWVGHASSEAMVHQDEATFLIWQGKDPAPSFRSALQAVDEALKLNDNSYLAHRNKVEILILQAGSRMSSDVGASEDLAVAKRHLDRVRTLNPSLAFYVQVKEAQIKALMAARTGAPKDLQEARKALEILGRKSVPSAQVLDWSEALLTLPGLPPGGFDAALRALEKSKFERPWDARILLQKGRMLLKQGRKRDAEAALKEAEARNTNLRPYLQRLNR